MTVVRRVLLVSAFLLACAAPGLHGAGLANEGPGRSQATKSRHPHYDDRGVLPWTKCLRDAQAAARASNTLIFIEYGREHCGNCKALVQNVLPDPAVKNRLARLCVGLAAECDPPAAESAVCALFEKNMPGVRALPFAAFVTPDLQWVAGFSGYKSPDAFAAILDRVEKSPLLEATQAIVSRLDALARDATASAAKSQWTQVVAAHAAATGLWGRCPARTRIDEALSRARSWAGGELSKAFDAMKAGDDHDAPRAALGKVAAAFADSAEGADADAGVRALDKLSDFDGLPSDRQDAARAAAAVDFAGTRWASIFAK